MIKRTNAFQTREWWEKNVQKNDWIMLKQHNWVSEVSPRPFFVSLIIYQKMDESDPYIMIRQPDDENRGLSIVQLKHVEEVLEIRRRGSIITMSETVVSEDCKHYDREEFNPVPDGITPPVVRCKTCGVEIN